MSGNFESKAVAPATYLLATPGPEMQYDVLRTKAAGLLATPALASQPSDLQAKLESLRDWMGEQMKGRPWTAGSHFDEAHKRLTAIIEGKD